MLTCRRTAQARHSCRLAHAQVISVDHSTGTTMCVVGLGASVAKQFGAQEGARHALPVMTPCLAVAELTPQQYSTAMRCALLGALLQAGQGGAEPVVCKRLACRKP